MSTTPNTTPETTAIHIALHNGIAIAKEFVNRVIDAQMDEDFVTTREAIFDESLNEIRQLPDSDVVRAGFDTYIRRISEFDGGQGAAE
jgi:hypothetical protein